MAKWVWPEWRPVPHGLPELEQGGRIAELKNGGYGYHSIYRNIPEFIAQADVAWYRRELGLGAGSGK